MWCPAITRQLNALSRDIKADRRAGNQSQEGAANHDVDRAQTQQYLDFKWLYIQLPRILQNKMAGLCEKIDGILDRSNANWTASVNHGAPSAAFHKPLASS